MTLGAGLRGGVLAAVLATPAAAAAQDAPPPAPRAESVETEARTEQPAFVVGGLVALGAAGGLAIGGVIAAADDSPRTTVGLLGLATASAGVGLPLLLLGAMNAEQDDREAALAGIVIATPGILGVGIGCTALAVQRAEGSDALEVALPPLLGGAAATVIGIVVWASGAGHDDERASARRPPTLVTASVQVSPTGAIVVGSF